MTLGLVEPQSSGPAGGAFMTYYDAATKEVTAYDGRETAPASATPTYFYDNGQPLASGRSAPASPPARRASSPCWAWPRPTTAS